MADKPIPLRSGMDALVAFMRTTAFGGPRGRPFVGQPWTWLGERGKPDIPRMSYRDLGDTIVEALRDFPGLEQVDSDALAQKVLYAVEQSASPPSTPERDRG